MRRIFNVDEWRETCKEISRSAAGKCGCIHDVYVGLYSHEIESHAGCFPEEHHEQAFDIAKQEGDYYTPEERAAEAQWNAENGYCSHGLDPDCCPCGCGDLEQYQ